MAYSSYILPVVLKYHLMMFVEMMGEERKKGIPLITFVYKEEDKAVLLKVLPLPLADIQPERNIPV